MKRIFIPLIISCLTAVSVSAQTLKIDLNKDMPKVSATNKNSPLAKLKKMQEQLKWAECSAHAAKIIAQESEVQGWVAVTWMYCLEQEQKKKPQMSLSASLQNIEKHKEMFSSDFPWYSDLNSSFVKLRLADLEKQVGDKNIRAANAVDRLLSSPFGLSADQRSQAYKMLGELAQLRLSYGEARFFFEEAQSLRDSKYLQDKIEFLRKTQGDDPSEKVTPVAATPFESSGDVEIETRIRQSISKKELFAALQDSIVILNQFPGSSSAKSSRNRPLELYNQISDESVKNKALNAMRESDGALLLEWSQNLHRRANYSGALVLSKSAAKKLLESSSLTSALWVAGRSAHFLGLYDEALEIYKDLIQFHAGSDEAGEALFRSSLIYLRKKEFTSASALLDRLLALKIERYELNARYWLVRALQGAKSDRAINEVKDVITHYPFSYYGMRLKAESENGKISWPVNDGKISKLKTEFYLAGQQKKSWNRFKILSRAGWLSEAQVELRAFPFVKDNTLKISLAQKLSEQGQYLTAIKYINEAMEQDPLLRREEFLRLGYPNIYQNIYQAEGERYKVSPMLLQSLTRQESGFNTRAVSTSNALGLMQMIPATADEVARKLGLKIEIPEDMFRPEVNIPMGTFYIAQMIGQFQGNVPFALAAYNAGPTRLKIWIEARHEVSSALGTASSDPLVEIWFDELPWTETSFYVKAILRNFLLYGLVTDGPFTLKPVLWEPLQTIKTK